MALKRFLVFRWFIDLGSGWNDMHGDFHFLRDAERFGRAWFDEHGHGQVQIVDSWTRRIIWTDGEWVEGFDPAGTSAG